MENIYGSSLKAHQYSSPTEPMSVANLVLAMRLTKMGHTSDFVTEFVTGSWSPIAVTDHLQAPCPELTLPLKKLG